MSTALATVDPRTTALAAVKCGYYKDLRSEEQALIKIMAGAEMGISPIQSLSNVHIVEGRPTIGVHGVAAAIRRSGRYDYDVLESSSEICRIVFVRLDRGPQPVRMGESVWTIEDARRAGLAGRGPWKSYAEDMLYARAMTRGARRYCPDVFGGGIYTAEELGAEGVASAEVEAPRPAQDARSLPVDMIEVHPEPAPTLPAPAPTRSAKRRLYEAVKAIAAHVQADVREVGAALCARFELASSDEIETCGEPRRTQILADCEAVAGDEMRARRWWSSLQRAPRERGTVNGEFHAVIGDLVERHPRLDRNALSDAAHNVTRHHAGLPSSAPWSTVPVESMEVSIRTMRALSRIADFDACAAAWDEWTADAGAAVAAEIAA